MARPPIPRIPAWEILALIAVVALIGSVATLVALAGQHHTVVQIVLLFLPPVILGAVALWLRGRSRD